MDDHLNLTIIPPEELGPFWIDVEPILRKALSVANEYDIETVVKGLMERDFQLWAIFEEDRKTIKSAAITTITTFPLKRVCTVVAGAGAGLSVWKDAFRLIGEWAKAQGCDTYRIVGRKGWARAFKEMKMTAIILEQGL